MGVEWELSLRFLLCSFDKSGCLPCLGGSARRIDSSFFSLAFLGVLGDLAVPLDFGFPAQSLPVMMHFGHRLEGVVMGHVAGRIALAIILVWGVEGCMNGSA